MIPCTVRNISHTLLVDPDVIILPPSVVIDEVAILIVVVLIRAATSMDIEIPRAARAAITVPLERANAGRAPEMSAKPT